MSISNSPLFYKNLLDNSQIGFMLIDASGIVIYKNSAYTQMTIYDKDNAVEIGSNMKSFIEKGLLKRSIAIEALERKEPVTAITVIGNRIPVLVTSQPFFNKNGDVMYVLSTVHDSSEFDRIQRALSDAQAHLLHIEDALKLSLDKQTNVIAASEKMKTVISRVNHIKDLNSTVLLRGESGCGKDVIANYIHSQSNRKEKPFITINCAAIPEQLLESELFGYISGSFTGAAKGGKIGQLEAVKDGTVFLDEIGDLPLSMQAKLLRVLENNAFIKIGDTKETAFRARVIAATNRHLEEMVQRGLFREDLYYRLNVITIRIPSLNERREDIAPLALFFLKHYNEKYGFSK